MNDFTYIQDLIEILKALDIELSEMKDSLQHHQQIRAEITHKLELAMQQQEYKEGGRFVND